MDSSLSSLIQGLTQFSSRSTWPSNSLTISNSRRRKRLYNIIWLESIHNKAFRIFCCCFLIVKKMAFSSVKKNSFIKEIWGSLVLWEAGRPSPAPLRPCPWWIPPYWELLSVLSTLSSSSKRLLVHTLLSPISLLSLTCLLSLVLVTFASPQPRFSSAFLLCYLGSDCLVASLPFLPCPETENPVFGAGILPPQALGIDFQRLTNTHESTVSMSWS